MGISPPSDIVLDVVRAADPARASAARADLARVAKGAPAAPLGYAAGGPAAAGADFSAALLGARGEEAMKTAWRNNAALYGRDGAGPAGPAGDTFREFEAVTLSTFVEALLPKDARAVFGSGSAGEIWRSMMAEKIAAEVAEAGGIGIADELERTFAEREGAAAGGADRADSSRG